MPKSNGHYSQCIAHGGILYLSGQLPIDTVTKQIPETIEEFISILPLYKKELNES